MQSPKINYQVILYDNGALALVVRTDRTESGHTFRYLLSRKTGLWINCTKEEILEHDIPSECLLPVGELPESLQIAPTQNVGSGKPFTTP